MFTKVIKTLNNLLERLTPRQLLIGTIVAGVVVCLLVYLTISHIEQKLIAEQPEPVELTRAVVARINIPRGALIQENMLKVEDFAVGSLPKGTTDDVKLFVGLPTKLEIFAGDVLTSQKVFTDYREAGFIGMIPNDCRAVSIPIDTVTGIAGLIKAGDYVDVVLVSSVGNSGTKAEVLLQNVLLLSINQNSDRDIQKDFKDEVSGKDLISEQVSEVSDAKKEFEESADELLSKGEKINKDAAAAFEGKGAKGLGAAGGGGSSGDELGVAVLALRPDDILKIAAATEAGTIHLALRPLKPKSDSMFINETEYVVSANPNPASQSFLDRQNRQYQPNVVTTPQPVVQQPAPQPVVTPVQAQPARETTSEPPKDNGFEIIQWGN